MKEFRILADGELKIYYGDGKLVDIPNNVTSINEYAFRDAKEIDTIIIPSSIVEIHPESL